jgi:hypothetical protein
MRKSITWVLVAGAGFALMLSSYLGLQRLGSPTVWTNAVMCIGRSDPTPAAESFDYVAARLRFLPTTPLGQALEAASRSTKAGKSSGLWLPENVVSYPRFDEGFTQEMLASGRLPFPGRDELLAGWQTQRREKVTVAGRTFKVVGVLRKEVVVFGYSYVIPADPAHAGIFDPSDRATQNAYIVRLAEKDLTDKEVRERLTEAFPTRQLFALAEAVRVEAGPYFLYMAGFGLLLAGGAALLTRLYVFLAGKGLPGFVRSPLAEIRRRRRLLLGLHLGYFGLVVLMAALAYFVPAVQVFLLEQVGGAFRSGQGPLGVAGKAYGSGNIPVAAAATLAINFLLGSLAYITLPSVVLPGIGALAAGFRALLWGLVLAPGWVGLSKAMLPHSFTLLLEGEGYVLASFFALLIPMYLFRPAPPAAGRRFGRALLLNLQGNLLVLIVLAVAAAYEAVEVILQMK